MSHKNNSWWDWPGAMMSSYFLLITRTNVKSFCGSKSRTWKTSWFSGKYVIVTSWLRNDDVILTVERALLVSCIIKPAYWTVVELSRVERIGIPKNEPYLWVIIMSWWRHRLHTFFIDDDSTSNSLVGWDSLHYFFDFRHFSFLNSFIIWAYHDSWSMSHHF